MSETPKLLLHKDGPIGWIIFNQPEKRNAVSLEMWQRMPEYVRDLATDDTIRVVVLRGLPGMFCSGADLKFIRDGGDTADLSYLTHESPIAGYGEAFRQILEYIHSATMMSSHNACNGLNVSRAVISVEIRDRILAVGITDDGVGGADLSGGTGMLGLADRVEALGGVFHVESPPGRGTRLTAEIPLRGESSWR